MTPQPSDSAATPRSVRTPVEAQEAARPRRRKAPKGSKCPGCGLNVGGFFVGTSSDGKRMWSEPVRWSTANDGRQSPLGGLDHVEGGRRCRPLGT